MNQDTRQLSDLVSVGKAAIADFKQLGIFSITDLKEQDAESLYYQLCDVTGRQHDVCVLDVFHCAIAQANNPSLPAEQCQWWYWSQKRKGGDK